MLKRKKENYDCDTIIGVVHFKGPFSSDVCLPLAYRYVRV